jgi:integrase
LTWRAVNVATNEIAFTAQKTGRRIVLPLVQPLVDYLSELPASDNPDAFLFPNAAKYKRTTSLSNQFYEILVEAGLAEPRPNYYKLSEKDKKGRDHARDASQISFHSLRHTATTMLKNAGVSLPLVMAISGHESEAVSRQYTHHSTDDLRRAMERLPDVSVTPKATREKRGAKK